MLKMVFMRMGRKRAPDFRIVVRQARTPPKSGKYIEAVGSFNAKTKKLVLYKERILHWLKQGVKPSSRTHNLLVREKVISGPKVPVTPRKSKVTEAKTSST